MKKTGSEIEHDVYNLLKSSDISAFVKGKVYKGGTRPHDSKKEDIVISFLTGLDGQIQEGAVNVNVYFSDVDLKGQYAPDISRLRDAESKASASIDKIVSSDYHFYLTDIIQSFKADNDQHFVNVKLKFKRLT